MSRRTNWGKKTQRSVSGSFTPLYVSQAVYFCLFVYVKVPIAPPSRRPPATRERLKSPAVAQTKNAAGAGRRRAPLLAAPANTFYERLKLKSSVHHLKN